MAKKKASEKQSVRISSSYTKDEARRIKKASGKLGLATWQRELVLKEI